MDKSIGQIYSTLMEAQTRGIQPVEMLEESAAFLNLRGRLNKLRQQAIEGRALEHHLMYPDRTPYELPPK